MRSICTTISADLSNVVTPFRTVAPLDRLWNSPRCEQGRDDANSGNDDFGAAVDQGIGRAPEAGEEVVSSCVVNESPIKVDQSFDVHQSDAAQPALHAVTRQIFLDGRAMLVVRGDHAKTCSEIARGMDRGFAKSKNRYQHGFTSLPQAGISNVSDQERVEAFLFGLPCVLQNFDRLDEFEIAILVPDAAAIADALNMNLRPGRLGGFQYLSERLVIGGPCAFSRQGLIPELHFKNPRLRVSWR